jgi:hypothetical protein
MADILEQGDQACRSATPYASARHAGMLCMAQPAGKEMLNLS